MAISRQSSVEARPVACYALPGVAPRLLACGLNTLHPTSYCPTPYTLMPARGLSLPGVAPRLLACGVPRTAIFISSFCYIQIAFWLHLAFWVYLAVLNSLAVFLAAFYSGQTCMLVDRFLAVFSVLAAFWLY